MNFLRTSVVMVLMRIQGALSVIHSLRYFYTASSGIPNFPSYVSVGLVDDVQITYCDSNTNRNIPKQEWMTNMGQEHWERETQICLGKQQTFKVNLEIAGIRFNNNRGVHVYQEMYGCEWDDETEEVRGYDQIGYDGEDFIIMHLESESWLAAKRQAVISKNKWNQDRAALAYQKTYFYQECPEWLKKYLNYGRSFLLRTDLPSVFFLQKSSSSTISCFATGFYPNRAEMFWRKDGAEIHDGVEKGEILPNNDGTFQMTVDIDLSSVPPEDWTNYECVFQLSGHRDDIVTKQEKSKIRTNEVYLALSMIPTLICLIVLLVITWTILALFIWRYKWTTAKFPPLPVDNREVEELMLIPSYDMKLHIH